MSVYGPSGCLSRRFGARGRPSVARPTARRYTHGIGPQPIHSRMCVRPDRRKLRPYSAVSGLRSVLGYWQLLAARISWTGQVSNYRSATLLLWVLSGPVLKHGPRSLTCARVIGTCKPKGEMKVKIGVRASMEGGWAAQLCGLALPGRLVLIARRGAPRAYTLGPERW